MQQKCDVNKFERPGLQSYTQTRFQLANSQRTIQKI